MITLAARDAFAAYEAARHRLPSPRISAEPPETVASLAAIADRFDVFLLDAFGVLNIGETAIPGTAARIDDLRNTRKIVRVVSNAATVPTTALQDKYRRLGFDFALKDIVTSRAALAKALPGHAGTLWGVMHPDGEHLDDLGDISKVLLGDVASDYDRVNGFLLVGSGTWTQTRQEMLENSLTRSPRPVLVGNPDIIAPRNDGLSAEPGHFAHRLADRTGVSPTFFGKPFRNIYDLALAGLADVPHDRVLMVGDSLHTDILGGHAAGIRTALITEFGFMTGVDVQNAIETTGIAPDFLVARP